MTPGPRALGALAALAILPVAALLARQRPSFRSSVDTVEVHVTVRGPDGQLVQGLTKDDFELYDNGKRRDITVFSADVQPISVALLLDRSGSVVREAGKITAAAEAFVGNLLTADRAAMHSLSYECQPLTSDRAALLSVLRSPMQFDLGSPIWAGLDRTITSLAGVSGRRAILLFSDGEDSPPPVVYQPPVPPPGPCHYWSNPSQAMFTDASKRAQREGIMVYTVSVESAGGITNDDDLKAIARGSGGERYRLKQESELTAAFTRIVDELHHQYLLGFAPGVFDGKVHSLDVRVKRPGLNVRARESYVAIEVDRPAFVKAGEDPAPLKALANAEVERAIRDGLAGQRQQAACMAFGTFRDKPDENDVFADVVFEGPIGRIMRAAREARAGRTTLDAAHVTEAMRAAVVQVTAELKRTLKPAEPPAINPTVSPTPTPTVTPTPTPVMKGPVITSAPLAIVSVMVRSKVLTEVVLPSLVTGPEPSQSRLSPRRIEQFDLAAFRALPGADVEVVVRSRIGPRACSIGPKDRAAIR